MVFPDHPHRVFNAAELSDGTLRYVALAGALLGLRRNPDRQRLRGAGANPPPVGWCALWHPITTDDQSETPSQTSHAAAVAPHGGSPAVAHMWFIQAGYVSEEPR